MVLCVCNERERGRERGGNWGWLTDAGSLGERHPYSSVEVPALTLCYSIIMKPRWYSVLSSVNEGIGGDNHFNFENH